MDQMQRRSYKKEQKINNSKSQYYFPYLKLFETFQIFVVKLRIYKLGRRWLHPHH